MPSLKISELTELIYLDVDDLIAVVDTSEAETKKVKLPTLEAMIDHTHIMNIGTNTHAQIDTALSSSATHIADGTLHFTVGSIDHTAITNIGTNSHAQIDTALSTSATHIADSTLHFTVGSIDHTAITNIGTNSHATIDTHIASTSNPHSVTKSQVLTGNLIVDADVDASAAIAFSKLAALTASKALVSDASGVVSASSVTATELGYISGLSSAVQTQLNGKAPLTLTTNGDVLYYNSGYQRLAKGTDGQVLTLASGIPSWSDATGGFSDPMTSRGDVIFRNASNITDRLAIGTVGKVLYSDGTDISWSQLDHTALGSIGSNTHAEIDTAVSNSVNHIADATLHFTVGSIDHTAITNIGTNSHAQIDTAVSNSVNHIADSTLHFTVGSIDHTAITNIGTNSHATIDTHIASTSNPHSVTKSQVLTGNLIVDADVDASAALALSKLAALTASKALESDASGFVSASSVTATELGYLSGVTSAVQTQIGGLVPYSGANANVDMGSYNLLATKIGLGCTPSEALDVIGSLRIRQETSYFPQVIIQNYKDDNSAGYINFGKARGTISSPSDVTTNDAMGTFVGQGYASGAMRNSAGFSFNSVGTSGTNVSGQIRFATHNGTTYTNRMILTEAGNLAIASNVFYLDAVNKRFGINTTSTTAKLHIVNDAASSQAIVAKAAASQTANILETQNSSGTVLTSIGPLGSINPVSLADSSAPNNSIYYSTTASKLVYKDSGGTVNNLY